MAYKWLTAAEVAHPHPIPGGITLDHAIIREEDMSWLENVERLFLWNVKYPPGFLARLKKLWWLDVRGGSGTNLDFTEGLVGLKYLAVNQVRGMADLSRITSLPQLRLVLLYGLPKVKELPPFTNLAQLECLRIGQMTGLESIAPVLQAPRLRELLLSNKIPVSAQDVEAINQHPALEGFGWNALDIPLKVKQPVMDAVKLPQIHGKHPEEWFGMCGPQIV